MTIKKIMLCSLGYLILLLGCGKSNDNHSSSNENDVKLNFPAASEKYGKEVAKEMRGIVTNLNEDGYDFTNVKYNAEAKNKFYLDAFAASPTVKRTKAKATSIETFMGTVAGNETILTETQIKFVDRIINEFSLSKSTKDLAEKALKINKDIYATVPSIQQERIFNVAAVLYYGVLELDKLEKEGLLTQKSISGDITPRLKMSADGEDGGLGASCTRFLATGWTIAVGEPTIAGEIVMSVVTVVVAGVLLYEVITCPKSTTGTGTGNPNQSYCQMRYATCTSPIPSGCSICLQYCLVQGYWPSYSTHQCN